MTNRVVLLGSDREDLSRLYAALKDDAEITGMVIEKPVTRKDIFVRRIKKFGFVSAIGQALFVVFLLPFILAASARRRRQIYKEHGLEATSIPDTLIHSVDSINSPTSQALLRELAPSLVVVYGTRIISRKTLAAVGTTVINIHAGITPYYRGGHGGYWALAEGNPELCGVTVHEVDAGIDTGKVLGQACIVPTPDDSFATYPALQLAQGVELIRAYLKGTLAPSEDKEETSKDTLYAHPTLWGYLYRRIRSGVR